MVPCMSIAGGHPARALPFVRSTGPRLRPDACRGMSSKAVSPSRQGQRGLRGPGERARTSDTLAHEAATPTECETMVGS
jgi:hypothetical protein